MTPRRELFLFLAAALVPAAAMGLLGWRALRNEEAALRREANVEVSRQAERVALECRRRIERAESELPAAESGASSTDDKAQLDAYQRAAKISPPFAEAIVLSADATLLLPREKKTTDDKMEKTCAEAVPRLSSPDRAGAVKTLLDGCEEARDTRGRWVWPVLALERLAANEDDALLARFDRWAIDHADKMRAEERAVTVEEVTKLPHATTEQREGLQRALSGTSPKASSVAPILARWAKAPAFVQAVRAAGVEAGSVASVRSQESDGAIVVLEDGSRAGFLMTPETLGRSLLAQNGGWSGIERGFTATVTTQPTAAADTLAAPEGVAWVTEGLGVRVRHADPTRLKARTTRSERILVGLIAFGILLALAFAFFLYRRMRATRRTSELRTSFVAGISHELRTPLASVRMLSELLAEGRVEENERAEVAEALVREARRMGDTVERFLAYAKSERGKLIAAKKPVDLRALVDDRAAAFRERHPGAAVEVGGPEELVAVVDRPQIEIVVDNLLENAKKYAPSGEPYEVSLSIDADRAIVTVTDHGPGVPRAHRRRVFEAFERGDDRITKAASGTGLGLFLVRSIARAHGGDVTVGSGKEGGARFVVELPRGDAPSREDDSA